MHSQMTEKRQKILDVALSLFAKKGYAGTSTASIAEAAGVSEGLIFRHFRNKSGLLQAVADDLESKQAQYFGAYFLETDPKEALSILISTIINVPESDYDYWRLQYQLKWQAGYQHKFNKVPLMNRTTEVFKQLGYEDPEREAQILYHLLDGVFFELVQGKVDNKEQLKQAILEKYIA